MLNSDFAAAVLLDRDGTINENREDYVKSWEEFRFLSGALSALRLLASTPFRVVIVSNQSAIGRNLVDRQVVDEIHKRMLDEIAEAGGRVDRVFYCPHRPDEGCDCRKPRPGLLLRASRELGLDLSRSYFVGDSQEDVDAAYAAGCTPILVCTGRGAEAFRSLDRPAAGRAVVAQDLQAAVKLILRGGHELMQGFPAATSK
jgi:D-glycero-D-manno-heptose 1,7-bisphosphate phosphatase